MYTSGASDCYYLSRPCYPTWRFLDLATLQSTEAKSPTLLETTTLSTLVVPALASVSFDCFFTLFQFVQFFGLGDALEKFHRYLSVVNCDAKHRKVRSAIRVGTLAGEWLLRHEAYTMWKEETSSTRLLWIKGVRESITQGSILITTMRI